ncbi:hypothetical protein [Candidatus Blastococcus massiliensis]|uniref:hypothetical protein n=1 Tax=Candidatus Blastococcus massiliensis TaxID=1470358 RepID=UPI0004BCF42B|nr:hypothetical protein [Candidatus Blastococcus massiliensis]
MERHERNPLSPVGQIDSWGDLASGLRSNRRGRRRAFLMLLALLAVVTIVTALAYVLT